VRHLHLQHESYPMYNMSSYVVQHVQEPAAHTNIMQRTKSGPRLPFGMTYTQWTSVRLPVIEQQQHIRQAVITSVRLCAWAKAKAAEVVSVCEIKV
jgi:hypothetical protein